MWGVRKVNEETPLPKIRVVIDRNQVLLWRGDVIHAGGFAGNVAAEEVDKLQGVRSFRLHQNLILCKDHARHCPEKTICQSDIEGKSLDRLYGDSDT